MVLLRHLYWFIDSDAHKLGDCQISASCKNIYDFSFQKMWPWQLCRDEILENLLFIAAGVVASLLIKSNLHSKSTKTSIVMISRYFSHSVFVFTLMSFCATLLAFLFNARSVWSKCGPHLTVLFSISLCWKLILSVSFLSLQKLQWDF